MGYLRIFQLGNGLTIHNLTHRIVIYINHLYKYMIEYSYNLVCMSQICYRTPRTGLLALACCSGGSTGWAMAHPVDGLAHPVLCVIVIELGLQNAFCSSTAFQMNAINWPLCVREHFVVRLDL